MDKIAQLISTLFEARNKIHIAHLQTTSYAAHVALAGYYDNIIGLADTLAEAYQGRHGIINNYPTVVLPTDSIELLTYVRSWIDSNRFEVSSESEIQNMIDTILELHDSTLYKLKQFK